MNQREMYDSDFMILKRFKETAVEMGGWSQIKSDPELLAKFKKARQSDANRLMRRHGRGYGGMVDQAMKLADEDLARAKEQTS